MHESAGGITSVRRSLGFYRPNVVTLLLLFVAVAFGCGERNSTPIVHESNLRVVAVLYSQFVSANGGEIPQGADNFRTFVQSLGPGVLERAGCLDSTSCCCRVGIASHIPSITKASDGDLVM